ncbi:MAG: PAS domain-containing protein [Proteobacteria bacterium]|nr:PAS domain-containing protein [Pseudomonadota bacterium]
MRENLPVSQREFELRDEATLMSTTDPSSHLRYANDAFVEVSGFTREELAGQPHNIVRHPDMPREAFEDLWATLRRGDPWSALVKNRRKNGDHYWVRANVIPVVRDGQTAGYLSVRTKPGRDEVAQAESLYRDMREGRAGHVKLQGGVLLRKGLLGAIKNTFKLRSVRWRLRVASVLPAALLLSAAAQAGVSGTALISFAGVALTCAVLASWWLEAQIARPLAQLRQQSLDIATGARRDTLLSDRLDDIGMTFRTVNQMGLMFRWLVDDISSQVEGLQSAISEIAQGNHDLSTRTEQAAASVQQTAASMDEVSAGVRTSVETAQEANVLSGTAREAAERGGKAMSQVVRMMDEIATSSRRIADIIATIDGIAFQTNILALNAAVEAARAGEQGRGFAVVAGEVRALAQRSADAAKEIRSLIGASVEKVTTGTTMVGDAGQTIGEIVDQVRRVSALISEISSAAETQRDSIGQVGQAVSQFDDVTQQNAALVEESAAASSSVQRQATLLAEAVRAFR